MLYMFSPASAPPPPSSRRPSMALPHLSAPVEDRNRLWLPVTIRVAWELLLARVRIRPAVLADAREHVLRCLPSGLGEEEAEALASVYTRDYLARARHGRYQRPPLEPDLGIPVPRAWRDRLNHGLDPVADAVLRMHYGDGLAINEVERHAAIHAAVLEGAREGLREAMRAIAAHDGQPIEGWPDARVDQLLSRVATMAGPSCPGPAGLLSEAGREHAGRCPRCSRGVRLIRQGVISPQDLFLPEGEGLVAPGRVAVAAVLLHPDGRKHRDAVGELLDPLGLELGQDGWLLPAEELPALIPALRELAEAGTPPRHQLRGAVVEGPGRWRKGVILGPVPVAALEEARSRPWAEIDRVGELPLPLPPPPSAAGWWAGAAVAAAAAILAGFVVLRPATPEPFSEIEAAWTRQESGWDLRFDLDDLATVDVVVQDDLGLRVDQRGVRAEKGSWATGEGDFKLALPAARAALIASDGQGVGDLEELVAAARVSADPVEALAKLVRERHPTATVVTSPLDER